MKKIFSLAIVTAMLTSIAVVTTVSADTPKGNADYFASKTETKITVDGKKDASYAEAPIYIKTPADDASAAGAKGVVSLAWDNEYLYVFNEVTDAAITPENAVTSMWSDDGMEVYINLSGEEADYYSDGINAGQYTVGPFFSDWGGGGYHRDNNMDISEYAWEITDKGYNIELAIYWGDEFEAAEGNGFFDHLMRNLISGNDSNSGFRIGVQFESSTGTEIVVIPFAPFPVTLRKCGFCQGTNTVHVPEGTGIIHPFLRSVRSCRT